jgi:probable rRNA maturation factor
MNKGRRLKPAHPTIDVLVSAVAWTRALRSAAALCRKAARAAWAAGAPAAVKRHGATAEVSIVLTTDAAIRKLNAAYRKKDKPTNVLSFPADDAAALGGSVGLILGDVVIAYGTVAREAREARKSLKDHLSHMVVHGVLHLLGYDHETAPDAETMESLETKILSKMRVPDPYRDTDAKSARVSPARPRGVRRKT